MNTNETITLLFAEQGESLQEKLVQILENLVQGGELLCSPAE